MHANTVIRRPIVKKWNASWVLVISKILMLTSYPKLYPYASCSHQQCIKHACCIYSDQIQLKRKSLKKSEMEKAMDANAAET